MKRVITILAVILIVFDTASACKCSGTPPTVEENWKSADQVFIGDVIDSSDNLFTKYGERITRFTIRMVETFKREIESGHELRTFVFRGDGSCDYKFRLGQRYLIYATNDGLDLFLSEACSRTSFISGIKKNEIEQLRKLYHEPESERKKITENSGNDSSSGDLKSAKALNSKLAEDKRMLSLLCATLGAITIFLIVYVVRGHKTNA